MSPGRTLGGTWRAAVADDGLRRVYTEVGFDDGGWEPIEVPGHWRSTPAFADTDGPLLYRRCFDGPEAAEGRRHWLVLDGLFYQGDVWLDGGYLGNTEGYFFPHAFEVTEALSARGEHALAVEATCARPHDRTAKRNLTGVFEHWDCADPDWNPGGIWRPVRLEESGPVRIRELRVLCREAGAGRAVVSFTATLDTVEAANVVIGSRVGDVGHYASHPLAAGQNTVAWTVVAPDPPLWGPRALGHQAMVDVEVTVAVDEGGGGAGGAVSPSDRRHLRTGLRSVTLRDWVCSVNGERLFLKGTNLGPTRMPLAEASPEEVARDVGLAVEAGLDLVRVHAHVGRPELYDAADEAGLLVWQDLPLQWGYARGVRRQAVRQARAAVDLLGHHPSVAVWCGHNEPMAVEGEPGRDLDSWAGRRVAGRFLVGQQLPTWNRTMLDRSIKRALEKADGTRAVVAHSGVLPHLPQLEGTDSHLYLGWYWGDERGLPDLCARLPRLARFVGEFGAQAVPEDASFCRPERWPDLDWEHLARHHGLQRSIFDRYVAPADHADFASWRAATQAYQAELVKHHVETLRRLKYRPTGGFAQFFLADAMPAVTWSVLGHDRQAKAGYGALAEACRPVIVVADRPPRTVGAGDTLALDVHVVSDLRTPLVGLTMTAVLSWEGGEHRWRWQGDVPADGCVRVGTVQAVVPATPGPLTLALDAQGPATASNAYTSTILAS